MKDIKKYSVFKALIFIFTHRKTFRYGIRFIFTVLVDFFILQFKQKLKITKIPVINVSHELDDLIPFDPNKIYTYLDFTKFWIRAISIVIENTDKNSALIITSLFLKKINLAYHKASCFYSQCMTTTNRPRYYKKFGFRVIHVMDPHLLCVPSLHIAVVTLVWCFYKDLFTKTNFFTEEQKKFYLNQLYNYSLEIGETVLYVKQHSVNCIPAALYMMNKIMKNKFTANEATKFINDLFKDSEIAKSDKAKLSEYMNFIYERFLLEGTTTDDWTVPIKSWLKEYCNTTNQSNIAMLIK